MSHLVLGAREQVGNAVLLHFSRASVLLPSRFGRGGGLVDQLHLMRGNISMSGAGAAVGLPPDHQLGPAANAASDANSQ